MYTNVITTEALALLKSLAAEPMLAQYRLVGGTALALQYGHRKSIDLDMFLVGNEHVAGLETLLRETYRAEKYSAVSAGKIILAFIRGIKVDFVCYPYAWIEPPVQWEGVTLAAPPDIAAMKISAIGQRGSKKDFFDIAQLLKVYSLKQILEFFELRYPSASKLHYCQALTYFADAEDDLEPELLPGTASWESVKAGLQRQVANLVLNQ
jgi:predicted nucleotidyltransferase component of viral defense system